MASQPNLPSSGEDMNRYDELYENYSGQNAGSASSDENMTDMLDSFEHESEAPRPMGPPQTPVLRRAAPSPEASEYPSPSALQGQPKVVSKPRPETEYTHEGSQYSSEDDSNSDSTIKSHAARQDSPMRDMSSLPAAFQQRAGPPTSLLVYEGNHKSPNYTDLEDPKLSDAMKARLEAMRAKNAEENYHYRIPPENAPPHLQMMVLLYQWAAWAQEILDEKKRRRMMKWVNRRTLDFMMRGGRIPGYTLKELLEIAGVDPKEAYGPTSPAEPPETSLAYVSSSQLAATINGAQEHSPLGKRKRPMSEDAEGNDADDDLVHNSGNTLPALPGQSSPDQNLRQKYQQTYFKAQLNGVLQNHRKPQMKKQMPEWSKLGNRLRGSGVSVNMISYLREDYENGWKRWDGSAFTALPDALQTGTKTTNPDLCPIGTAPSDTNQQPNMTAKPRKKPKAAVRPRRTPDEEFNSDDGEFVAAKSEMIVGANGLFFGVVESVRTRRQATQPQGRGRGDRPTLFF